jgi:hypothetical protein
MNSGISRSSHAVGLALLVLLSTNEARATEPRRAAARGTPASDVGAAQHLGVWSTRGEETEGGLAWGATGLYRYGFLAAGATMDFGLSLSSAGSFSLGPVAGVSIRTPWDLRVDVLGSGGARFYHGWGRRWFSDDPGASAWLSDAGGQARLAYVIWSGKRWNALLGVMGVLDDELSRRSFTYEYEETPSGLTFGDTDPYLTTATHVVGGVRWLAGLSAGFLYDL